jgi:hypothetical protein
LKKKSWQFYLQQPEEPRGILEASTERAPPRKLESNSERKKTQKVIYII